MAETSQVVATVLLIILLLAVVALIVITVISLPKLIAAVNNAVAFVNQGIVIIGGVANSLFLSVQGLLTNAFAFVTDVAEDVGQTFVSGVNTAINVVTNLGTQVIDTIVSVFNDVRAIVLLIIDSITSFFETIVQPIIDEAIAIFNAVRDFVALITCFLSNLICCGLSSGCTPPAVLDCCDCGGNCPPGLTCDGGTGRCV